MATKIPKDVLTWFQRTGSEGGKTRAARYSKEQLSEWGRMGGRPRKDGGKKAANVTARAGKKGKATTAKKAGKTAGKKARAIGSKKKGGKKS